jgi:4-diphosphocytidyl-2-C-methyl-D-erythritol kinase
MKCLTLKANAKINLGLHVKYKRPDGYHEIETVFQEIDFCDNISLKKSDRIIYICDDKRLSEMASNLCVRAAELLRAEFGIPGLHIELQKRIPVGAGLGGGSSDAAAVIRGGLELYGVAPDSAKIMELCARLGSDVPFFVSGKSAYATGRGEQVNPIKICSDYQILLLFPGIHISTAWAYKNLKLGLTHQWTDNKFKSSELHELKVSDFKSVFFNSFEDVVFRKYPVLADIKQALFQNGALFAGMSGSGSTLFGLYAIRVDLSSLSADLQKKHKFVITVPVD